MQLGPYDHPRELLHALKNLGMGLIKTIGASLMLIMLALMLIPVLLLKCVFYKESRGGGIKSMLILHFYYPFLLLLLKLYGGLKGLTELFFIPVRCLVSVFYHIARSVKKNFFLFQVVTDSEKNDLVPDEASDYTVRAIQLNDIDYFDYIETFLYNAMNSFLPPDPNADVLNFFGQAVTLSLQKIRDQFKHEFSETSLDKLFSAYRSFKAILSDLKSMLLGVRDGLLGLVIVVFILCQYPFNVLLACFSCKSKDQFFRKFEKINAVFLDTLVLASYFCFRGFARLSYILLIPYKLLAIVGEKLDQCVKKLWNKLCSWNKLDDLIDDELEVSPEISSLDAEETLNPLFSLSRKQWVASILDDDDAEFFVHPVNRSAGIRPKNEHCSKSHVIPSEARDLLMRHCATLKEIPRFARDDDPHLA
ncbi:MAG: hypothetical protein NTW08_03015 [Gammaproteobacteria bacterium]|nr:hypothetical protein [Gammaproteobacteria bacterium]